MHSAGHGILQSIRFTNTPDWNIKQIRSSVEIRSSFPRAPIGCCIVRVKDAVTVEDGLHYKRITIKTKNGGVVLRDELPGKFIKTKVQYRISSGQLAVSKIDARNGAFGIVSKETDGAIITGNFWVFNIDAEKALPDYLTLVLSSSFFIQAWFECSNGSGNRLYLQEEKFLRYPIPLPPIDIQRRLLDGYFADMQSASQLAKEADAGEENLEQYLFEALGIEKRAECAASPMLRTVPYRNIAQWGYDKNAAVFPFSFRKYKAFSFHTKPEWVRTFLRGKSPRYSSGGTAIILNQKCNRSNEIVLNYVKTVDRSWADRIPPDMLTKRNDILINSTGEGTLGRASCITDDSHIGLAFDSHILLLRVDQKMIDPQLLTALLNSSFGQKQVALYKSAQATKQTELGIENTKRFLFPMPDISCQHKISSEILARKENIRVLRAEAERLRQRAGARFEKAVFGEV